MKTRIYWTKEEIDFIKSNFEKMTGVEMAKYINKKPPSIQWKLRKLGLSKLWSTQEIEFIKTHRPLLNFDELSLCLNRTKLAIKCKCEKFRFVRPRYNLELLMTPSLAYIVGCLCGDASILDNGIRLCAKDEDFTEEFKKHCENILLKHYIKPTEFNSNGVYYVQVGSQAFKHFIIRNFGWLKTENWKVPDSILNSDDKKIISSFLRGFYDSEGNYHDGRIRVQVICPSLSDCGVLLKKLGIDSRFSLLNRKTIAGNQVYGLILSGEKNVNLFRKRIGFTIKRKQYKVCAYLRSINETKRKHKLLRKNRRNIAQLYRDGNTLQNIANLYDIESPVALTPYIKSVLKDNYGIYVIEHLSRGYDEITF